MNEEEKVAVQAFVNSLNELGSKVNFYLHNTPTSGARIDITAKGKGGLNHYGSIKWWTAGDGEWIFIPESRII